MQRGLRLATFIGALALIIYGILQPIDQEVRWLICLWLAAPLLGLSFWLAQPRPPFGFSRNVYQMSLVVAVGFVLVSLQLLRQQVVQADVIYNHVVVGQGISNIRPVLAAQRVERGSIFDRTNLLLVQSEVTADGLAHRTYPLVDLFDPTAFGNITGFFSLRYGQSGLEATYSDHLSGEQGNSLHNLRNDILGYTRQGNNLFLTIDARLQARASALLGNRSGSIVVLDPRSGAVLAMASVPGFDPRGLSFNPNAADRAEENARIEQYWLALNDASAGNPLLNRPTQGQYPPGSTFKTVTAVAALEYPMIGEPDTIRCFNELAVETGAPPVVNAVPGLASLTGDPSNLERVYAYSCNVAFAQYALRLGADRLTEVSERFDIFAPANAPDVYTQFGDLPTLSSRLYVQPGFLNRDAALADTGYGQGQLLVTPLQMALVAAAIANDGLMMQPYLVERITNPDDQVVRTWNPRAIRRVMSPEIAATMRNNMRAVGQYGFGSSVNAFVSGFVVGGKSGTAELGPGIMPHSWFIAIAPVDQPRYAVCVMVENGGEGSTVAAELAGRVLQAAVEIIGL